MISVGYGGTLRTYDGSRSVAMRLASIDAPETAQTPQGSLAREALKRLAPVGSEVSLKPQKTDGYERTVAEVFRCDINLNLTPVRMGQVFVYEQYLNQCQALAYMQTQSVSEFQWAGVWAVSGGLTRPWDWRTAKQGAGSPGQRTDRTTG